MILCLESIYIKEERDRVITEIEEKSQNIHAKKIIDINYDEMNGMGGNMLML